MTILSGDKIERLLFDKGFDASYIETGENIGVVEIVAGEVLILLSEAFPNDGEWAVDSETLTIDKLFEDQYVDDIYDLEISDENEIVDVITNFVGENV